MLHRTLSVAVIMLTTPLLALAQGHDMMDKQTPVSLNTWGSVRGSYWTGNRQMDDTFGLGASTVILQSDISLGRLSKAHFDGRTAIIMNAAKADLRELYIDHHIIGGVWRIGRQVITWGAADAVNPTDNLGSRDFTILSFEEGDSRRGVGSVRARYALPWLFLTAYWIPEFRPNITAIPPLPEELSFSNEYSAWVPSQIALKVSSYTHGVDWSISYCRGKDRNGSLFFDQGVTQIPSVKTEYSSIDVVGADGAFGCGLYAIRFEASFMRFGKIQHGRIRAKDPVIALVVGSERMLGSSSTISLQILHRTVIGARENLYSTAGNDVDVLHLNHLIAQQLYRHQTGASVRLARKFLQENLDLEGSVLYWLKQGDFLLRSRLVYNLSDRWKLLLGYDLYCGPVASFLGRLKSNSLAGVELRYAF